MGTRGSGLKVQIPMGLLLALLIVPFLFQSNLASGQVLFRTWGGKADDGANGVAFDSSSAIYLVGGTDSFGSSLSRVFLLKYASSGALLWQKVWGGSYGDGGLGVAIDSAHSVYVTGLTRSFNPAHNDQAFLLKVNSTGSLVWQKAVGNSTRGVGVALSPSGDTYVVTQGFNLFQFDPSGKLLSQKTLVGNQMHGGSGVAVDAAGSVYLAGDILLKLNSTGNLQWARSWGATSGNDSVTGVAVDTSGNIIAGGFRAESLGLCRITVATVAKFESNGSLLWHRGWQESTSCDTVTEINSVAVDAGGNIFATGTDNSVNAFLMELDSMGDLVSLTEFQGLNGASRGFAISVDSFGTPASVGEIMTPYRLHSGTVNPTLDTQTPQVLIPSGSLQSTSYSEVSLNGNLSDVSGTTSYGGASDAFVSYGFLLSVPSFNPLQIVLLAGLMAILPARYFLRRKLARPLVRSALRHESGSSFLNFKSNLLPACGI